MWIHLPPVKLCAHCLIQNPKYYHVSVKDGVKACNLSEADIDGFPILDGKNPSALLTQVQRIPIRHTEL